MRGRHSFLETTQALADWRRWTRCGWQSVLPAVPLQVCRENPSPPPDRVLHARVATERLGSVDIYFDTGAPEQVIVGQTSSVRGETYYDLWMSFPMRSVRKQTLSPSRFHGPTGPAWTRDMFRVASYTIHSSIDSTLNLAADAELVGSVSLGGTRILMFELSRYLQVKSVEMDGTQLEFIQNETIEGSELSRRGNDLVAVVFPHPLAPGTELRLKFIYSGSVLTDAGGGLFYVGARGTWYPNRGVAMANYDVTFRFPRSYTLVATGKQVSLDQVGEQSIGHWVSEGPIPIAGFNLGRYVRSTAKAGDTEIVSYATRGVEKEMPKPGPMPAAATSQSPVPPDLAGPLATSEAALDPAAGSAELAAHAATTILALDKLFGPYPFSSLALTQRPGTDSQGWPGMIFLSSYVYLTPAQRTAQRISPADNILYGEVMMPHEVAHQWFGDQVSWASYHEQWLLEAIANYSSLMLLEQENPTDEEIMLQAYRQLLATKSKEALPNVEAGPVTLGIRLASSRFPAGYEVITYGRGTWLIHMLREMFRDASRTAQDPNGSDRGISYDVAKSLCRLQTKRNYQPGLRASDRGGASQVSVVRKSAVAQLVFRRLGKWNGVSPLRPQGRPLLQSRREPHGFSDPATDRCARRSGYQRSDLRSGRWSRGRKQNLPGSRLCRRTRNSLYFAGAGRREEVGCGPVPDGSDSSMMALVGWHALVRKLLGIRTLIVPCHLSRASQNILVGSQAFHTNRAARVQLTR